MIDSHSGSLNESLYDSETYNNADMSILGLGAFMQEEKQKQKKQESRLMSERKKDSGTNKSSMAINEDEDRSNSAQFYGNNNLDNENPCDQSFDIFAIMNSERKDFKKSHGPS